MNILKVISYDAHFIRERNDIKGKEIVGYDYIFENNKRKEIDENVIYSNPSNYVLLYSNALINKIQNVYINEIFRRYDKLSFSQLLYLTPNIDENIIIKTLQKIINEKIVITNRFNKSSYLYNNEGFYYLSDIYNIGNHFDSYYISNMRLSITITEDSLYLKQSIKLLNSHTDKKRDFMNNLWKNTTIKLRSYILENILIPETRIKFNINPIILKWTLEFLSFAYFVMNDAIINVINLILISESELKGRLPILIQKDKKKLNVIVRIYKYNEKKWRETTLFEDSIYLPVINNFKLETIKNKMLQIIREDKVKSDNNQEFIFGYYHPKDGSLTITNFNKNTDFKLLNKLKGKACITPDHKGDLRKYAISLGITDSNVLNMKSEEICKHIEKRLIEKKRLISF